MSRPHAVWLIGVLLVAACGGDGEASEDGALTGTVTVFAAASLTDAFRVLGDAFEAEHAGVSVAFNFGGSSALATQIEEGAPADVIASANDTQLERLSDAGLIAGAPQLLARNALVIVVPADNPAGLGAPADLAQLGLRLVLALEDVPAGRYARAVVANLASDPSYGPIFEAAALANLVSEEADVRAVLAKVELGEADAGVVYRTDAAVAGDAVAVIEFPPEHNVVAAYPIAVTSEARNRQAAEAFVAFTLGEAGQRILVAAGFDPAP